MNVFRIHGDNIVECERIAKIILNTLKLQKVSSYLSSPSTPVIALQGVFAGISVDWRLELLPGFNKNTKRRWSGNIFDALREAGSFFDETPDAIISRIEGADERILLGIEFCSALQAGNQAWQRSARAFSTGRTGCPYLYIVDFVKYELDKNTRKRKNLRFPNPAVPYSYVSYSKNTGNFVAQLYTKSEEFDRARDSNIAGFDESDFGSDELGLYMVKLLLGMDTAREEELILRKNMNVVQFLADHFDSKTNFTPYEWQEVYGLRSHDIVDYSLKRRRFRFHKTIAAKSHHGASAGVIKLVDALSVGLASRDLPFGIIPADARPYFANGLLTLYPGADLSVLRTIARSDRNLIVAIFKGFKPGGDDNRPDRGAFPLAMMLAASDVDVLTYVYGPVIEENLQLLDRDPMKLAERNGLWRSILALSSFVILDVPVLAKKKYSVVRFCDTGHIKNYFAGLGAGRTIMPKPAFPAVPVSFGEDDVDTGIHYLFTHVLGRYCFEGMCNPPGGDWSGFSVIDGSYENRWLSLPRVSNVVNGKRPDHILELFEVFRKPLLLSIESKERSADLEADVGTKLVTYIERLMDFVPSAKRKISPQKEAWQWGDKKVKFRDFETMSAAAYLGGYAERPSAVFEKNCEILFVMHPVSAQDRTGWVIEVIPSTERGLVLKNFMIAKLKESGNRQFFIK